jgi:hypothetical protein
MWQQRIAPAAQIPTTHMDFQKKKMPTTHAETHCSNTRNEKAIPHVLLIKDAGELVGNAHTKLARKYECYERRNLTADTFASSKLGDGDQVRKSNIASEPAVAGRTKKPLG